MARLRLSDIHVKLIQKALEHYLHIVTTDIELLDLEGDEKKERIVTKGIIEDMIETMRGASQ